MWDGSECDLHCSPEVPNGTEVWLPKMVTYLITPPLTRCFPFPVSLLHSSDGASWDHLPNKPLTPGQLLGDPNAMPRRQPRSRGLFHPLPCLQCFREEVLPASRRKKQTPVDPFQELIPKGEKKGEEGWEKNTLLLGPTCALFKAGGMKFSHIKF